MNSTISIRLTRTFRLDFCRYLSVQPSVNRSSNTCNETINFQRKIENCSSNLPLFKQPFQKSLCNVYLPLNTNFYRNYTKQFEDPLKGLDKPIEPDPKLDMSMSLEEELEKIEASLTENLDALSDNPLVEYAEKMFLEIHNITGLPWWASIALTAVFVRTTITLPFSILQVQVMGKLQVVTLHMQKVTKRLRNEAVEAQKRYGWPKEITEDKVNAAVKNEKESQIAKENCSLIKTIYLVAVQVPTWTIFSLGLRKLCLPPQEGVAASEAYTELSTGGFGWITDLTAIDSTFALPLTLGIVYCLIIETHRLFRAQPYTTVEETKCLTMQCLNVIVVGMSSVLPSALSVYWLSSALYGLVQAFVLNTQFSYRLLNIPVLHTPMEHPYRLFKKNLKNRFKKKAKEPLFIIKK